MLFVKEKEVIAALPGGLRQKSHTSMKKVIPDPKGWLHGNRYPQHSLGHLPL